PAEDVLPVRCSVCARQGAALGVAGEDASGPGDGKPSDITPNRPGDPRERATSVARAKQAFVCDGGVESVGIARIDRESMDVERRESRSLHVRPGTSSVDTLL